MTTPDPAPVATHWVVDKRIPLALVITILIQTGGAIWWAASISNRVTSLENTVLNRADQATRIVRVETQVDNLAKGQERIERKLDRLLGVAPNN